MELVPVHSPPKPERRRKYDGVLRQVVSQLGQWFKFGTSYSSHQAASYIVKSYADFEGPNGELVEWEIRRVRNDASLSPNTATDGDPEFVYELFLRASRP